MLKQLFLLLTLSCIALTCSGCVTILGGIIGYQSGELAAGMAIGAAIDFGDDIARGIGQMTANDKDLQQDFLEKSTFNTAKGEITLPICPFNRQRVIDTTDRLRNKFEENGWTCERTEKAVHTPLLGPVRWEEKWQCATDAGKPFAFQINFHSDRDTRFYVSQVGNCSQKPRPCGQDKPDPEPIPPSGLTSEEKAAVTGQIYRWIEQVIIPASS